MALVKLADRNGQEYAHKDISYVEYNYTNDEKRVTDKINKIPEGQASPQPAIKIKVIDVAGAQQICEDHRQKVYKIETKPQMRACVDNPESYALSNTPRQDEINNINGERKQFEEQIKAENTIDMTSPNGRFAPRKVIQFEANQKIMNKEEGIKGTIKFANTERVSVLWDDGTRERFTAAEAKEYLQYVDDIESIVSPLTPQNGKTSTTSTTKQSDTKNEEDPLDSMINKALAEMDDDVSDVENGLEEEEREQFKRKISTLEQKLANRQIEGIKDEAADETLELMASKGYTLDYSNKNKIKDLILLLDDNGFEAFKNLIIAMPVVQAGKTVTASAAIPQNESPEAALRRLRGDGGTSMGATSSRDLKSIKEDKALDFSNFQNIQGITKPIQASSSQMSYNGAGTVKNDISRLSDEFSKLITTR